MNHQETKLCRRHSTYDSIICRIKGFCRFIIYNIQYSIIFPVLSRVPFKYSTHSNNDGNSCCQTRNEIKTPILAEEIRQDRPLPGAKVIQVVNKKTTSANPPICEREYKDFVPYIGTEKRKLKPKALRALERKEDRELEKERESVKHRLFEID
jgi:hypothetical protein